MARRPTGVRRSATLAGSALSLLAAAAPAAWTPAGIDLTRPRILLHAADLPAIQARLERQPYRTLLEVLLQGVRQADRTALDDHTINAERIKARAAKNLAFLYAVDRTVIDGQVVPFPSAADREAAAGRVRELLLSMYTRCRLAVPPPLGGFDRDINTSEELQQYATAYDAMRGAGYDFGGDDAAIVANLVALAAELYENYADPDSANGYSNLHQNNHRSKAGAALASAAIALAEYTPAPGSDPGGIREPAVWFAYGLDQVDLVMRYALVSGDGAYGEGPFYLRYASQNLLPFWRAWDRLTTGEPYRVGGVDIPSFWRHPLLGRMLQWALDTTLPDGSQAPIDDANVGLAYYFGAAPLSGSSAPALAWRWSNAPVPYETDGNISLAAESIVNFDDQVPAAPPSGSPTAFYVDGGTAVFRSDWTPQAVLAIVQAEHDTASEFGRDRDGRGVAPESHEHAEPGAFLLHAFGERLALDPGYFSFTERGVVAAPEDHNIILVDGTGPTDYLAASLAWLSDRFGRPPVDGHAMLSATLDSEGLDAAHVTTRYGQPAARAARIERRYVFADDRYLLIADRVDGPADPPRQYTWLLHGNGGGDSGGTFEATATGGRWRRPGASLEAALAVDTGTLAFDTAEGVHEAEGRARKTHTVLRARATGSALHAVELVYPLPAGAPAPRSADLGLPGVAGVVLSDDPGDRLILALHRAAGGTPLSVPETMTNLATVVTDGSSALFDATGIAALRLAWVEEATYFEYGDLSLRSHTAGRLGLRLPAADEADVVVDTADPSLRIDGLHFLPRTADGACALLDSTTGGATIVLGRERRVVLRAGGENSRPAADPGPDRVAFPPEVVMLHGRGSCDADADALTPQWELVAAPAGSAWSLEDTNTWTPRLFVDRIGPYRVRLTVTDASGAASRPAEVVIRAGDVCENGLDDDLDGLFDSDDPDCDTSNDHPIDDRLDTTSRELRVGAVVRDDLTVRIASGAYPLTFQTASTDPSVAAAELSGGELEIHANRPGAARVVVTADDAHGRRTFDLLDVRVAGPPACVGDCDADGVVTVDEVLTGVAVALGSASFERCSALDGDVDGQVEIGEIITAVQHALGGCL